MSAYWRQSQLANCTPPISQRKAGVFAEAGFKDVKLYHIFLPQTSLPTLRFGGCMQTWKYLYLKQSKESYVSPRDCCLLICWSAQFWNPLLFSSQNSYFTSHLSAIPGATKLFTYRWPEMWFYWIISPHIGKYRTFGWKRTQNTTEMPSNQGSPEPAQSCWLLQSKPTGVQVLVWRGMRGRVLSMLSKYKSICMPFLSCMSWWAEISWWDSWDSWGGRGQGWGCDGRNHWNRSNSLFEDVGFSHFLTPPVVATAWFSWRSCLFLCTNKRMAIRGHGDPLVLSRSWKEMSISPFTYSTVFYFNV